MSHLRDRLRVIAGLAPLRHVEAMLVLSEHLGIAEAQEKYPGMVEQATPEDAERLYRDLYVEVPELELDASCYEQVSLPSIGTRVRIPVTFYRVAKVVAHKDGGVDVELPGDSKTLWVAAGDLEAEG